MTKKYNLVGKRIRVEKYAVKDKDGNVIGVKEREILETDMVDKPRKPCKHCKKNERAYASSSCKECSLIHQKDVFTKKRLADKINQQRHEQTTNNR